MSAVPLSISKQSKAKKLKSVFSFLIREARGEIQHTLSQTAVLSTVKKETSLSTLAPLAPPLANTTPTTLTTVPSGAVAVSIAHPLWSDDLTAPVQSAPDTLTRLRSLLHDVKTEVTQELSQSVGFGSLINVTPENQTQMEMSIVSKTSSVGTPTASQIQWQEERQNTQSEQLIRTEQIRQLMVAETAETIARPSTGTNRSNSLFGFFSSKRFCCVFFSLLFLLLIVLIFSLFATGTIHA